MVSPVAVDATVVAALLVLLLVSVAGAAPSAAVIVLAVAQIVPLWWRRRYPLPVVGVQLAASACARLVPLAGGLGGPTDVALVLSTGVPHLAVEVGLYTVAAQRGPRPAVLAVAVDLAVSAVTVAAGAVPFDVLASLAVRDALFVLFGLYLPVRRAYLDGLRERADQLERQRQLETAAAVREERARIARELHDVVAHHVSVMLLHAGALQERMAATDPDPDTMAATAAIRRSGRDAMTELRRVLAVLRDASDQADERRPQPSLEQVDDVVERMRQAGLPVELERVGDREISAGAALTVVRVVQESLTNVLKHAGAVTTHVAVQTTDDAVRVRVANAGGALAPTGGDPRDVAGAGTGIAGMRERVTAMGGSLAAGPQPEGGWVVEATVPEDAATPGERGSLP